MKRILCALLSALLLLTLTACGGKKRKFSTKIAIFQ